MKLSECLSLPRYKKARIQEIKQIKGTVSVGRSMAEPIFEAELAMVQLL